MFGLHIQSRLIVALTLLSAASLGFRFRPWQGHSEHETSDMAHGLELPAPEPAEVGTIAPARVHTGIVLPRQSVEVATPRRGKLLAVLARMGAPTSAGEVVAQMGSEQEHHEFEAALATLRVAQAELEMAAVADGEAAGHAERRRAAREVVSRDELLAAEARAATTAAARIKAQNRVTEQQAQMRRFQSLLADTQIRAPFDGLVAVVYQAPGVIVEAGSPILKIIDTSQLRLRFGVEEDEVAMIPVGKSVRIDANGLDAALRATIVQVSPEVDPFSNLVLAEAVVEPVEPFTVRPGLVVEVTVSLSDDDDPPANTVRRPAY